MNDLQKFYIRIPILKDIPVTELTAKRLGGLTNLVYCLTYSDKKWLLRVPGEGTSEFINRQNEEHDAKVAADTGVSAKILFFDGNDGLMLSEFIEGETLSEEKFQDLGSVRRSGKALRQIHQHPVKFKNQTFKSIYSQTVLSKAMK